MTDSKFEHFPFSKEGIEVWSDGTPKANNWPIVYTLNNDSEIYVGETTSALNRMRQHLQSKQKLNLNSATVILNERFNKSACLDLESHLIRYFAADDKFKVLNANNGVTESDYFQRSDYRQAFEEIFDELLKQGILTRSVPELINSDFFKYSPFKSLTNDQAVAVEEILEVLFSDFENGTQAPIVVQGNPGTGKTIVAIYLIKLLIDVQRIGADAGQDEDSLFSDFFQDGYRETLTDKRIGFIVPQQSLRKTLQKVFKKTPGLSKDMVLSPFDLGKRGEVYDLLVVDEAHRLRQRSNQEAASQNKSFRDINISLFGSDSPKSTQLDWVRKLSKHQVLLVDIDQSVRPGDLPKSHLVELIAEAKPMGHFHKLVSQLRIPDGGEYVDYISQVFSPQGSPKAMDFGEYDVRFFDNFGEMEDEIRKQETIHGLSRVIAGIGWPWLSKRGEVSIDFTLDGRDLVWNRTATDWINSPTSIEEVGSIHTVQGYDLNFAGVIVGPELDFDLEKQELVAVRASYFDSKGKQNNPGATLSDVDLLGYICNIYRVLMTRGIKGTYIYVANPSLRAHLKKFFPQS